MQELSSLVVMFVVFICIGRLLKHLRPHGREKMTNSISAGAAVYPRAGLCASDFETAQQGLRSADRMRHDTGKTQAAFESVRKAGRNLNAAALVSLELQTAPPKCDRSEEAVHLSGRPIVTLDSSGRAAPLEIEEG